MISGKKNDTINTKKNKKPADTPERSTTDRSTVQTQFLL